MIRPLSAVRHTASLLLLLIPIASALAAERVIKEYSFTTDNIDHIDLQGAVGTLTVVHTDKPEVNVVLEIRQQDDGWFDDDVNLENVELDSEVHGSRLALEQTTEEVIIDWTVELPTVARTSIDFGVGEIDGQFGETELRANLGVGEVDVTLPLAAVGAVDLSVGVGEATLRGAGHDVERRAFISQDVSGEGNGDKDLDIEVGVGEIRVGLED